MKGVKREQRGLRIWGRREMFSQEKPGTQSLKRKTTVTLKVKEDPRGIPGYSVIGGRFLEPFAIINSWETTRRPMSAGGSQTLKKKGGNQASLLHGQKKWNTKRSGE